ncbi:hypothetical protein C8F01DRAFT_1242955 [Mycena amicta]|nr:hypothetical protein C8F01DRAFT_1242955 [Mycena amicta]
MSILAGGPPMDPAPQSELSSTRLGTISVCHPGYNPAKILFMLPAYQAPSGEFGVPYVLVLDGCAIFANNEDGFLRVRGSDTNLPAPNHADDLLPAGQYTYHVDGKPHYAICTSFRAWTPPPLAPAHWVLGPVSASPSSTPSDYATVVKAFDSQCAVTGANSRLETRHLVPEAEDPWWTLQDMDSLTENHDGVNSPENCLVLRADLNGAGMDHGDFVFGPYGGKIVCLCITERPADFAVDYHLRAVRMPTRIHPLTVLAGFAWGLFKASDYFLRKLSDDSSVITITAPDLLGVKRAAKRQHTHEHAMDGANSEDESMEEYSDDAALEPPLDVYDVTEQEIRFAESLPQHYENLDMYPGYSKVLRLAHEYRKEHPEVSAVRSARVARVRDDDDEQQL